MIYAAQQGREWTAMSPQELASIREGGAGSMASLIRVDHVSRAAEEALAQNPVSRIESALARLHIPEQETPPDYAEQFIRRTVADGWPQETCLLCDCTATEAHLASTAHLRRLEAQALGDFLAGPAKSLRNITDGRHNSGMYEIPTQAAALRHWGASLTNLVPAGLEILREKGIRVDTTIGGSKRRTVLPEEILTAELGLIKYCGSGKYHCNDFWFWQDLPTDLDILERPAGDQLADPALTQVQQLPPHPERGHPRPHSSMQPMDDGDGWWPVLAITLVPSMQWIVPQSDGYRVILIICFYQLMGQNLVGWWLEIPIW